MSPALNVTDAAAPLARVGDEETRDTAAAGAAAALPGASARPWRPAFGTHGPKTRRSLDTFCTLPPRSRL
jgi:hypothetical protein